MKTLKNA